jgi:hypothetical protein
MRSAVAGATTIRSAERDSSIWPISASSVRLNNSVNTRFPAQARHRQRRDELLGRPGQDGAHANAAFGALPDQLQALVGGDAAADDEQNLLAVEHVPGLPAAGAALCQRWGADANSHD